MEKEKPKVIFRPKASKSIESIGIYIAEMGYPERAEKFADKLHDFGYSLAILPEKYAICRHAYYTRRKYRCAVFKKNYVFIYKVVKKQVVIYNVIHSMRLR